MKGRGTRNDVDITAFPQVLENFSNDFYKQTVYVCLYLYVNNAHGVREIIDIQYRHSVPGKSDMGKYLAPPTSYCWAVG